MPKHSEKQCPAIVYPIALQQPRTQRATNNERGINDLAGAHRAPERVQPSWRLGVEREQCASARDSNRRVKHFHPKETRIPGFVTTGST
jgi:hypothetical protein